MHFYRLAERFCAFKSGCGDKEIKKRKSVLLWNSWRIRFNNKTINTWTGHITITNIFNKHTHIKGKTRIKYYDLRKTCFF